MTDTEMIKAWDEYVGEDGDCSVHPMFAAGFAAGQIAFAAENKKLRHLLFVAHGNAEHYLYGDDGERSCNTCMIDFNRDSAGEIERKIHEHNMRKLAQILPRWAARVGATPPSKAPEEPPSKAPAP
jgi:hypothetical protein